MKPIRHIILQKIGFVSSSSSKEIESAAFAVILNTPIQKSSANRLSRSIDRFFAESDIHAHTMPMPSSKLRDIVAMRLALPLSSVMMADFERP